jgi:hypothetical protein
MVATICRSKSLASSTRFSTRRVESPAISIGVPKLLRYIARERAARESSLSTWDQLRIADRQAECVEPRPGNTLCIALRKELTRAIRGVKIFPSVCGRG